VIAVVMGVSGAGKTAIGEALAAELGWRFIDADDYHPEANVAKMAAGQPLDDEDRWPWLDRLNTVLKEERQAVLACSALKERYRARLARGIGSVDPPQRRFSPHPLGCARNRPPLHAASLLRASSPRSSRFARSRSTQRGRCSVVDNSRQTHEQISRN
jgi:hypothetical protein